MTSPLDSHVWYRVCDLKPRLRHHIRVHRHHYRKQRWYVLEDPSSGRIHRLDQYAYQIISYMNGEHNMDSVWLMAGEKLGDRAPTQDQSIQLLGQLHAADVLHCDVPPDTQELFSRYEKQNRSRLLQAFRSPFFQRIPLLDPETLLGKWIPYARPFFSRWGLALGLLLVLSGGIAAAMNWQSLVADARTSLLSPINLLLLWLVYPVVKALHELGHALAVKHWGGEVHDTGVMLLVFMPVPYVDASTANAFDDKWSRIVVSGAGIAVEMTLAALAMLVWLAVEPGVVRTIALDVMTIGGISTLLFNGNPLLKFDGYYVLSDLIEIPNLGSRSSQFYGYLFKRYLLGLHNTRKPVVGTGERNWLLVYGFASFVYRTFILIAILFFVAGISLTLAVVLGAWGITGQIVIPTVQKMNRMLQDPQVRERRVRAVAVSLTVFLVIAAILLTPMPHRSMAEGTVWMDEDAQVRTGTDCFVERLLTETDTMVTAGTPLVECSDPFLDSRLKVVTAQLRELQARLTMERSRDVAKAQLVEDEMSAIETRLDDVRHRTAQLFVRSPTNGVFVMPSPRNLPGRYVEQGELLAYVIDNDRLGVRVAVSQQDVGLIRADTQAVEVRLAGKTGTSFDATVKRLHPGATRALPSAALGSAGGGKLIADPADDTGHTVLEPVFLLDLEFGIDAPHRISGSRVFVRFDHTPTPLAVQWYRDIRQLLLRQLAV
ncbi:MAG: efflux RND transporter periplasmic adaptor subunit [Gammaproteobacteria bacterium]|nr:efflux RND transporter periplasmic adaptor subunit [Gammaproteobacteria bacterium]MDH3766981.1 efflux RND transporter periplasmic adaptor subunit [Gammaproteobacteria bacterium]